MKKVIKHYGVARRSGRYPWGSGKDPEQRNTSFLGYVEKLKSDGLSEVEIARGMGLTTTELRQKKTLAKAEKRKSDVAEALRLKDKGMSNVAIGERMGINESSVRSLLKPSLQAKSEITETTTKMLKESVDKKDYIDIGVGVENHLGISRTKLKTAVSALVDEGYTVHYIPVEQLGTGKNTTIMTLAKPNTPFREVFNNRENIKTINEYSEDGGRSFLGLEPVRNISSERIKVRYAEDGGTDKDGVIEVRRGVDELSLGNSRYTQARIGVDGTHYLKGMVMYNDNMPDGVDIIFNTNKSQSTPKLKTFKEMKDDVDNPFGATVRQRHYIDKNGERQLSAINVVNEEGDWGKWSKTLSSQMLSKQNPSVAKKQLDLAYDIKKEEYDEIMKLTNPVVRKKLLDSFADDADASAVHLKAAALPRQGSHVILPFPDMKQTEIFAPNYRDGEQVVLIRYPHGGKFEIPELTVNNKHKTAKSLIPNAKDAVGIHPQVAERLSGADFDGDTVIVIPNNQKSIKTSSALKGLVDFDPRQAYPAYEGMPRMSPRTKQMKMGDVSNLITDMTIKGANSDELARAVRHSMVVIDAEKHHLNYKQSYTDNGIGDLKRKYQGSERSGASTLISRSSSESRVPTRKVAIDPKTGSKIYTKVEDTYVNRDGKTVQRTMKSTKMFETDDAFTLSSGTPMETVYATHANKLKALGDEARRQSVHTKFIPYSAQAKKTYSSEVDTLNAKLNIALQNKPMERQAQLLANTIVSAKRESNPDMDAADLKKIKGQALTEARLRTGAKKQRIEITPREWDAIQSGAISTNKLNQILNNSDLDSVKQLAMPRTTSGISPAKVTKAKQMLATGYTQAEVSDALGISTSTLSKAIE